MNSFISGVVGFWLVLAGGICIGKDRYAGSDDAFPWTTLIGVAMVVAGAVLFIRSHALAAREALAAASAGPPPRA